MPRGRRHTTSTPLPPKRPGRPPGRSKSSSRSTPPIPLTPDLHDDLPTQSPADVAMTLRDVLRDVQIAICKIFGMTHDATARSIVTPDSPDGISPQTVTNRLRINREWIERLVMWGGNLRREVAIDTKEIVAADLRSEMEKDLGFSWGLIRKAIKEGNTELAVWHIEQAIGKASQPHSMKVQGRIAHEHVWQPERLLIAQEQDITSSDALLSALPKDVIDAELVD